MIRFFTAFSLILAVLCAVPLFAEGPEAYERYRRSDGLYPPNDEAAQRDLRETLRGYLLQLYPDLKDDVQNLEIQVFDTEIPIAEIHYFPRRVKRRDGTTKVKRSFHLALSRGMIVKLLATPEIGPVALIHVVGHEFQHRRQIEMYGWTLNPVHSQEFERDADTAPIKRMVKAGIDPRPLLDFYKSPEGIEIYNYKSNLIAGILSSHPNYEFRMSSLQLALANEFEGKTPKVSTPNMPAVLQSLLSSSRVDTAEPQAKSVLTDRDAQTLNDFVKAATAFRSKMFKVYQRGLEGDRAEILQLKAEAEVLFKDAKRAYDVMDIVKGLQETQVGASELKELFKGRERIGPLLYWISQKTRLAKNELETLAEGFLREEFRSSWRRFTDENEDLHSQPKSRSKTRSLTSVILDEDGPLEEDALYRIRDVLVALESKWPDDGKARALLSDSAILSFSKPQQDHLKKRLDLSLEEFMKSRSSRSQGLALLSLLRQTGRESTLPWIRSVFAGPDIQLVSHPEMNRVISQFSSSLALPTPKESFDSPKLPDYPMSFAQKVEVLKTLADFQRNTHGVVGRMYRLDVQTSLYNHFLLHVFLDPQTTRDDLKTLFDDFFLKNLNVSLSFYDFDLAEQTQRRLWKEFGNGSLQSKVSVFTKLTRLGPTPFTDTLLFSDLLPQIQSSRQKERLMTTLILEAHGLGNKFRVQFAEMEARARILSRIKDTAVSDWVKELRRLKFLDLPWEARVYALKDLRETHQWTDAELNVILTELVKADLEDWKEQSLVHSKKRVEDLTRHLKQPNAENADKVQAFLEEAKIKIESILNDRDPGMKGSEAWQRLQVLRADISPPSLSDALLLAQHSQIWKTNMSRLTEESRGAYLKGLADSKLRSPFYFYDLPWSERVQRALWRSYRLAPPEEQRQLGLKLWMALANRGATAFTDHIFYSEVFPSLKADPQATVEIEEILKRQLVYDYSHRSEIFDVWYRSSDLVKTIRDTPAGQRSEMLAELLARVEIYFPEASPVRANILESISSDLRTNASEARLLQGAKQKADATASQSGLSVRLVNGILDELRRHSPSDQLLFLRFLRGDNLPQAYLTYRFSKIDVSDVIASKKFYHDANDYFPSISLADFVESMGQERLQRFWSQMSVEAQAGLLNPLLLSPTGLLSTPERQQSFVEAIIPEGEFLDRAEVESSITDFIDALKASGRSYLESFSFSFLFFQNRQGQSKNLGLFFKTLFESQGPVGIALGQRLANLDVFDESTNLILHELKDRASPLDRHEVYQLLRPLFPNLDVEVLLEKQPLGSASIKVVVDAILKNPQTGAVEANEAIALYRDRVLEKIKQGGDTLRKFLELRIARNPSRYGFLMPILENVIQKKAAEARAEVEVVASQVSAEIYRRRNEEFAPKTGWRIETVSARQAKNMEIIRMQKISAKRFSELSPEEKAVVSRQIIMWHSNPGFGEVEKGRDFVIIDPDIHSGNFLVDMDAKVIYALDKGQIISVGSQDVEGIFSLLQLMAEVRLGASDVTRLVGQLEIMTKQKAAPDLESKISDYLMASQADEMTGEKFLKDLLQVFRISASAGIQLDEVVQDWINQMQNLLYFEKHLPEAERSLHQRIAEKVMSKMATGEAAQLSPRQFCRSVVEILAEGVR